MAYNIETILAEKSHTIVSRGVLNTRMKDFYDIYMLINLKKDTINKNFLISAIENTFDKRNTLIDIDEFDTIIEDLYVSTYIKKMWNEYQNKNTYAKGIKFNDTLEAVEQIIKILETKFVSI